MSDRGGAEGFRGCALVTGATSGIGEAIARRLADDGFRVHAGGRRFERLERLAAEIDGVALPFDVTSEAEVELARAEVELGLADGGRSGAGEDPGAVGEGPGAAEDAGGARPFVLVNAAGVFDVASIAQTSGEVVKRNLEANLMGAINVTRAFLPGMLAARSGLVINVGSVAGWRAFPENSAYSASKYGLRGFHDVLLEEIRGTGVRACLLEPGAVDTPIWDPLDPDGTPHLPSRDQMLRPEDVARAAGFVAGLPGEVAVPLLRIERA